MAQSPIMSLMQDPAFAIFVTASGMQEELALADAARRRNAINQALGIQEEDIAEQGRAQRKEIAGNQESRGVFKSGQTLERSAESERAQARASALAQLNAATQLGDVESGLLTGNVNRQFDIGTNALDALTRQLSEQGEDSIDDEVAGITGSATTPLTGLPTVNPLAPAPAPAPKPKSSGGGGGGLTYRRAF